MAPRPHSVGRRKETICASLTRRESEEEGRRARQARLRARLQAEVAATTLATQVATVARDAEEASAAREASEESLRAHIAENRRRRAVKAMAKDQSWAVHVMAELSPQIGEIRGRLWIGQLRQ